MVGHGWIGVIAYPACRNVWLKNDLGNAELLLAELYESRGMYVVRCVRGPRDFFSRRTHMRFVLGRRRLGPGAYRDLAFEGVVVGEARANDKFAWAWFGLRYVESVGGSYCD